MARAIKVDQQAVSSTAVNYTLPVATALPGVFSVMFQATAADIRIYASSDTACTGDYFILFQNDSISFNVRDLDGVKINCKRDGAVDAVLRAIYLEGMGT